MKCRTPWQVTFDRMLSLRDPEVVTLRMIEWIKAFRETYGLRDRRHHWQGSGAIRK